MILILIITTLILLLDAIGDGLRTKGRQILHHICEVAVLLLFGALIIYVNYHPLSGFELQWLVVYYLTARIAGFDLIYNIIVGNKWNYVGYNSIFDKAMRIHGFQFFKVISLVTAVCAIIRLISGF